MGNSGSIVRFILFHVLASMAVFIILFSAVIFSIRNIARRYRSADLAVFAGLQPLVSQRNNRLMESITFLGTHRFLVPANLLLIGYFAFFGKHGWYSVRAAAISFSSLALMFILKYLFHRKRPLVPLLKPAKGLSFPSGHAIMSVSFFGLLVYFINDTQWHAGIRITACLLLTLLILAIGFSRIYLRVHYASDVIIGLIVGLIWLLTCLAIVRTAESLAGTSARYNFSNQSVMYPATCSQPGSPQMK